MNRADFLMEIGTEELPASHCLPAINYIRESFTQKMQASRLSFEGLRTGVTPRRLAIIVQGLELSQCDIQILKTGPAKRICYDENGALSPAALGFLKKNSAAAEDIFIQTTDKGEFIALKLTEKGKEASELLSSWILELIPQIPFGKSMVWLKKSESFSRPVRWLIALLGKEVLPISVYGVTSGRRSRGNRFLGLDSAIEITKPQLYFQNLKTQAVIPEREIRKAMISKQMEELFPDGSQKVMEDANLLETVTDLVEYPTLVVAEFEEKYLSLPAKVITSTISQNQKYFSILDSEGKLKNRFVFVSNGDPKHSGLIKLGNQKVVNARLADALWYFEEDTRHPLESYVSKLDGIVFHSSLGTLADKTGRVIKLTKYICEKLNLNDQEKNRAQRCAKLCKADLATLMLGEKEFTKLQGYIGMQYALSDQEDQAVAEGIYEHYQPRGQNDALPRGLCGALVALADKMDTVCGIIGIGLMPTGSADPYALRRAANGIVQIIADRDWELDLCDLIGFSLQSFQPDVKIPGEAREKISSFFEQRVVWLLKQMDIDYDVVDSVIRKDELLIHDLIKRARVLQDVRQTPDFIKLVIGFKRASNIIAGERPQSSCDPKLMAEDAEIELYRSLHVLKENIDNLMRDFDYRSITRRLIGFGAVIDRFFDAVLVNCDDPILRRNRHALLSEVREQFLRFADISMVVIESSNGE